MMKIIASIPGFLSPLLARPFGLWFGRADWPLGGLSPRGLQVLLDLRDDVWMVIGDVAHLAEVALEVVEFERFAGSEAHGLPVAHADGLFGALLVEFPVEKLVAVGRFLAEQRRQE